jgi:branched-chain amino acid transport system ATP-binding protein
MLRTPPMVDSEWNASERAMELLEQLGLIDYRDKLIGELSTGSRRVVDLACVIGHAPSVLLLDEPSSGIAQRETEALGPLLLRIREDLGCAMVIVEHDMPLISSVADRLVAMETGRVLFEGSPAETLSDPAVIASYLGTTPELISRSGLLHGSGSDSASSIPLPADLSPDERHDHQAAPHKVTLASGDPAANGPTADDPAADDGDRR